MKFFQKAVNLYRAPEYWASECRYAGFGILFAMLAVGYGDHKLVPFGMIGGTIWCLCKAMSMWIVRHFNIPADR